MKTTIGIPIFNDIFYYRLLLRTIRAYTLEKDYNIVVVDDGSPDYGARRSAAVCCKEWGATFIQHDENRGIAAAWNTATQFGMESGSEVMVLLNSDILVVPNWLRCAQYALAENRSCGKVASVYWEPLAIPPRRVKEQMLSMYDQLWWYVYAFAAYRPIHNGFDPVNLGRMQHRDSCVHIPARSAAPNGSGFAFLLDTYNAVGPFDERMKSFHEEIDFGIRCCSMLGAFSFGLPYPRTYHGVSRTFVEHVRVVQTQKRFNASRKVLVEKWEIPKQQRAGNDPLNYVSSKFHAPIPGATIKFLIPHVSELVKVRSPDGARERLPRLLECEKGL